MLPKHVLLAILGALTVAEASVIHYDSPIAKTLARRQNRGGRGGNRGGNNGGNNNAGNQNNGQDNGQNQGGNNNAGNNNQATCLQDNVIQAASASTGQGDITEDGQAASAT